MQEERSEIMEFSLIPPKPTEVSQQNRPELSGVSGGQRGSVTGAAPLIDGLAAGRIEGGRGLLSRRRWSRTKAGTRALAAVVSAMCALHKNRRAKNFWSRARK